MDDISAIIVVKNNPPHLFEAISSIQGFVKEIIVADIGIDEFILKKLNENKKVKIIEIKKKVPSVELIREELKQYASGKYILFLDPDEIVSEILQKILLSIYQDYDYIKIPRKNIIFGKWIKYSRWWPDYQVRLFKKDSVTWPKKIHTQPRVSGNGYTVDPNEKLALIHYNYESIDEFMQKFVRYAKAEASELSSFSLSEALKKAVSEFTSRYFADEGYKDGTHGFVLSFLQMFYYFLVYVYYWEGKRYKEDSNESAYQNIYTFFKNGLYETTHWLIQKKLVSGLNKLKLKLYRLNSRILP